MIKIAAGLFGLVSLVYGGTAALDARYELRQVHEPVHDELAQGLANFSYTALKKEIREIREALLSATDPQYRQQLEWDLQDAIDRLCREWPQDRECKK